MTTERRLAFVTMLGVLGLAFQVMTTGCSPDTPEPEEFEEIQSTQTVADLSRRPSPVPGRRAPTGNVVQTAPADSQGDVPCTPCIDYRVEDRFGVDRNGNGVPDLPNSQAYVHSPLRVQFQSRMSNLPAGGVRRWVFEPREAGTAGVWPLMRDTVSESVVVDLPRGTYTVRVRRLEETAIPALRRVTHGLVAEITVRDMLVVALGDSYASGEGNPERKIQPVCVLREGSRTSGAFECPDTPAFRPFFVGYSGHWADDGSLYRFPSGYLEQPGGRDLWGTGTNRNHHRSHRSTLSWPAQLALAIEQADSRSSVTLAHVAASGATIQQALGERPYTGVSIEPLGDQLGPMASQIDQLRTILGGRRPDVLVMSLGGNDVGFAKVIEALMLHTPLCMFGGCVVPGPNLSQIRTAINSGNWRGLGMGENTLGLNGLADGYRRLAVAIATLAPRQVILPEYPDPTTAFAGGRVVDCSHVGRDLDPYDTNRIQISEAEIAWARTTLILPLKDAMVTAAREHGWTFVDGVSEAFQGHGYCAGSPYSSPNYPGNTWPIAISPTTARWIRRGQESSRIQKGSPRTTTGTLHPNESGHIAIAQAAFRHLHLPDSGLPGDPVWKLLEFLRQQNAAPNR